MGIGSLLQADPVTAVMLLLACTSPVCLTCTERGKSRTGEMTVHGEYKVPGGKLVVVDLDVVDGQLRNVQLSGDFFLEPDTALAQMNAALNGLPAVSSREKITAAINAALGDDVLMYGFSADAMAETVQRALDGTQP